MLKKNQIIKLLENLNEKLKLMDVRGEIFIMGGAAMCLAFNAREATKDVDAIFAPTSALRQAIREVGDDHGLPPDWQAHRPKKNRGCFISGRKLLSQVSNPRQNNFSY